MVNLYGSLINHSPRSFFDISKVYPNAATMWADLLNTDIPLNGYVLIDYLQKNPEIEGEEGLYKYNFDIDNQYYNLDGIKVDYNQTVWQKRYASETQTTFLFFPLARLGSVLPYLKPMKFKGFKNQVDYQRVNAFPIQSVLPELSFYEDFGFNKMIMDNFSFDRVAIDEFNKEYPSIDLSKPGDPYEPPKGLTEEELLKTLSEYIIPEEFADRAYPNFYSANQDETIEENSYIVIDYHKKTEEDISKEEAMDKYSKQYYDLVYNPDSELYQSAAIQRFYRSYKIDCQHYGESPYHGIIFQKQENGLVPVCANRLSLKPIVSNDGETYFISTDSAYEFQGKIEKEILRAKTLEELIGLSLQKIDEEINNKIKEAIGKNSQIEEKALNLNKEIQKVNTSNEAIHSKANLIKTSNDALISQNNNITTYINNIKSDINEIKKNNGQNLSNEINGVIENEIPLITQKLNTIKTKIQEITTNNNTLKNSLTLKIDEINAKIEEHRTSLTAANTSISQAVSEAQSAVDLVSSNSMTMIDAANSINSSSMNLSNKVIEAENALDIESAKIVLNEIKPIVNSIDLKSNEINSISFQGAIDSLNRIKRIVQINQPVYSPFSLDFSALESNNSISNDIKNIITEINSSIQKINQNISNKVASLLEVFNSIVTKVSNIQSNLDKITQSNTTIQQESNNITENLTAIETEYSIIKDSNSIISNLINQITQIQVDINTLLESVEAFYPIKIEKNKLNKVCRDEYNLYYEMLQWYKNDYLPSIEKFNLSINYIPNETNTMTIEYPTI